MNNDLHRQYLRDAFPQRPRRPQFYLGSLLGLITGLCVVFAILGALGVDPKQTAAAFITSAVVSLLAIGTVESWRRLSGIAGSRP